MNFSKNTKPNKIILLTHKSSGNPFFCFFYYKICIDFTFIKSYSSCQVFFIVHRFVIKLFWYSQANYIPHSIVFYSNIKYPFALGSKIHNGWAIL